MKKITGFYLNKAHYIAVDEQGNSIDLEVNYWQSTFKVQPQNQELAAYAGKLLAKKHRVNFIHKMHEEEAKWTTAWARFVPRVIGIQEADNEAYSLVNIVRCLNLC